MIQLCQQNFSSTLLLIPIHVYFNCNMADIKEETEASSNVIPVIEENKTEHSTNLNITEATSEREGKKCSCGQMSCASCIVKFEATNNFNKELSNNSYCQSVSNKRVRTCNRCGEEFPATFVYRKHYMKCWREFRKKVSLVRSNKTFAKANKNFHKKKFPINTGNSFSVKKTCHLCGMHFRSAMHYTMHVRKKGFCRPPPFVCSNCGKTFKTIHHLVNHEKRKTPCTTNKDLKPMEEDVSFAEDDTEKATIKKSIKMVSKKSDSDSNNLKCIKCNAQFTLFYWYNRHISHPSSCKPNGYKRNKDKDSSWNLPSKNLLSLEEYKTAGGYRCQKCGHIFRFPYRLLAHLQRKVPCCTQIPRKLAPSEKPDPVKNYHEPNTVGASVHLQRNVLNSEKTNAGIKIIKKYWRMAKSQSKKQNIVKYGTLICCICDKTFFNSYTWNSHLKIHSTTGDKCLVKCPVCFSIFPSADELHCHQQETNHWGKLMKSRINNCRCPFCDKKFAYLGSRQNHVQRHLEDYPVQAKEFLDSTTCSHCESYFASEAKKMAHIRKDHPNVELAEKKKSIVKISEDTQKFNLEESTKSKDKMKSVASSPLPPVLSRNVDNASTVKRKKNTKNGNVHSCSFCEKKFVWLERLIAHQQALHSNCLIFQCSSCHQKFSSWSIIIHHIKKKHKNSKEDNLIIELGKSDDYKSECLNPVTTNQESEFNGDNAALANNSSSQEVYSCAVCKVDSFSSKSALIRHKKSRIHRRNLKLNFNSMSKLILHPRSNKHAIKYEKFNCSVCSQSFKSLSLFVPHRLGHFKFENPDLINVDENNPFCCEICSESIYQYQQVRSHLLNHLQKNKAKPHHHTKVADLSVTSDNKGDLTELPRSSQEVKHDTKQAQELNSQNSEIFQKKNEPIKKVNFICKLCKMGFRTKRLWKTHVRHHCTHKRTCKNCEECFKSRKCFLMHRAACDMTHRKHRCQYCSLDFSSSDDVGWHEKSCQKVRGTEGKEFNLNNMNNLFHCQHCQAPFLSLETCQEHEKQFCKNTCSVCKAHFTSPELLNEHMNEFHDAKQSVTCSICGIYLETTNALHVHLKTHECYTNENTNFKNEESKSKPNKTSVCPHCNKIYRGPYSLKEHLVIHNPFKCPICGKTENDVRGFRKHPCRLPNGTFATGIKYRRKWSKTKIAQMREEYCASLLTGQGHGSFQEIKEIQKTSEIDTQQTCKNSNFQEGCLDNSDKSGLDEKVTLDTLRENFSQLLYLFVADPELMNELGWGQRLIDDVLADVLQNMGQKSVIMDTTCSQIECLRENIRLLLRVCIKDQIMDAVDGENKLVDDIVIDMLGMCKASLENQTPMADVVS